MWKGLSWTTEDWVIRYMEVATRNWWPGKKVLVSPAWIERVAWAIRRFTLASPGMLYKAGRSSMSLRQSHVRTRTASTFTMACRPIGWTSSNANNIVPKRLWRRRPVKLLFMTLVARTGIGGGRGRCYDGVAVLMLSI